MEFVLDKNLFSNQKVGYATLLVDFGVEERMFYHLDFLW